MEKKPVASWGSSSKLSSRQLSESFQSKEYMSIATVRQGVTGKKQARISWSISNLVHLDISPSYTSVHICLNSNIASRFVHCIIDEFYIKTCQQIELSLNYYLISVSFAFFQPNILCNKITCLRYTQGHQMVKKKSL